ncbi:DNA-binding protein RFXANK isoform X2 [Condylostylus longicornis]|uniref:DNA-binding protein RFXANK isoform X2 n=1 Tax=Condylostylus longicornis TaxID=2530218 RepID=UPI00244E55FA|nr:DNA-binding protein RFXANK isoform X2 [Condylostylus longicornis]
MLDEVKCEMPNAPKARQISVTNRRDKISTGKKSAFAQYRPTILTNLQRGNTEATFCERDVTLSFHERCAQGEITEEEIKEQTYIDFLDSNNLTALHWACGYGQLDSVQMLIKAGANVNIEAPDMITPLLYAAGGGHHEIVRFLLSKGADIDHMDIIALMYAVAGNHPHTTNEILAYYPKLCLSNEEGETAYSLAIKNNSKLSQAVLEKYIEKLLSLE